MMAKEISRQLAQRAEDVARYLLPNGRKEGAEWRVGSINGESGRSLGVHLGGEKSGLWSDFATGEGGDLLDLWSATRKISLKAAFEEAKEYLGVFKPNFAYTQKSYARLSPEKITTVRSSSPVMDYLMNDRKLSSETIRAFGIGEQGREIVFPYMRDSELIFIKYLGLDRPHGKKQIRVEKDCEPCLYGWHVLSPNARKVALTEGEIDAISLSQFGIPALSVPFGGGAGNKHRWLEYEFDRLAIFDEIFLCFDNDSEGQAATAELADRLGRHRCRVVKLPFKDANACLQAGITKDELQKYFDESRTLDPEELKPACVYVDQVVNEFYASCDHEIGVLPPWEKARGKIFFRPDEISIWTGINGHGKSQFLGQIILSSMQQGARVCIASLEIKPKRLLARLTRQASGLREPSEPNGANLRAIMLPPDGKKPLVLATNPRVSGGV